MKKKIIKKNTPTNLAALGSFAIKSIIKFKVNLVPSLSSQHEDINCRKEKAPALIPFLTHPPHNSPDQAKGWTQKCAPLVTCSGLFQRSSPQGGASTRTQLQHLHSFIWKFAGKTP